MIIGITGYLASGKGEIAEYLESLGYTRYSFSRWLKVECVRRGMDDTLENLISLANTIRAESGHDAIARELLEQISEEHPANAVVESFRHPEEIEAFRESGGFVLLSVDAPRETRYERLKARGERSDESAMSFEDFVKIEEKQITGSGSGQQLYACRKLADYNVVNNGTVEDLRRNVDEVMKQIQETGQSVAEMSEKK
ncbi:MAG: AAA family ATPase [bacterium]|nr:AAA family ATPase [bacterium]